MHKTSTKEILSTLIAYAVIGLLIWGALCMVSCSPAKDCTVNHTPAYYSKGGGFNH